MDPVLHDHDEAEGLTIGFILYPDFDALDVAGPQQVFFFIDKPAVNICLIGPEAGMVIQSGQGLKLEVTHAYHDCPPPGRRVLFVPGGAGPTFNALVEQAPEDSRVYDCIKRWAKGAELVCSVCTGALLLARAGLLESYACTTHWSAKNVLALFPGVLVAPGYPRYVIDRNRVTGGGISSGIDEALAITEILCGSETARQVQLIIQYAPNPPFNSGDPSVASATTLHTVSQTADSAPLYAAMKRILHSQTPQYQL